MDTFAAAVLCWALRGFENDPCGPWALPGERTFLTSTGVQRTSPASHTRAEQCVQCCSVKLLKPCNQVGWAGGWPCLSRGMAQVTPKGPFPPQPLCGSVVSTVTAGQPQCHTRQEAGRQHLQLCAPQLLCGDRGSSNRGAQRNQQDLLPIPTQGQAPSEVTRWRVVGLPRGCAEQNWCHFRVTRGGGGSLKGTAVGFEVHQMLCFGSHFRRSF